MVESGRMLALHGTPVGEVSLQQKLLWNGRSVVIETFIMDSAYTHLGYFQLVVETSYNTFGFGKVSSAIF